MEVSASAADAEAAFLPGPRVLLGAKQEGPLTGLKFAAKDLIDVEGFRKTCGNPDWARSHVPAERTAPVIDRLLEAGAGLVGKTITDELAFSLEGENIHYGTPLNPRCPDRIPGGSSSGSASAVASGLVDFALGTDTGGSVRVPSSFCGIFGMRPTHASVPVEGVTPLAPSYDTLGWLAQTGTLLSRVGEALLPSGAGAPVRRATVVRDAFALMEPNARAALEERLVLLFPDASRVELFDGDPGAWTEVYRAVQGAEAWAEHGAWIEKTQPRFAPAIASRFAHASQVSAEQAASATRLRAKLVKRTDRELGPGRVLLVPSSPTVALPKAHDQRTRGSEEFRRGALAIGAIAGNAGYPQVSMPIALSGGCPVGLGVIGARGEDRALLALAASSGVAKLVV